MGDLYKSHQIGSLVSQVQAALENEVFASDLLPSHGYTHIRDQLIAINDFICQKIESTPDLFISEFGINQITAQYQQIIAEIQAFISDSNVGRLPPIKVRIDQQIMPLLWTFAPVTSPGAEKIVNSTFKNLQKQAENSLKLVRDEEARLTAAIANLSAKISSEEESLKALGETLTVQKAEALAVNAKIQQEYAEQETKRSSQFSAVLDTHQAFVTQQVSDAKASADSLIAELIKSRDEAARLVEAVGDLGTTGNYKAIAKRETDQANLWRRFAAGIFVLGMALAMYNFAKFLDTPYSPENAISALLRLVYAIVITTPAWYAARESARHRSNADRARQTELELAALGPFIELMPEEKKISIRENLIKTYFGNTSTPHVVD